MNEQDCIDTYHEIESTLSELQLQWVIKQVAKIIQEGKKIEVRESGRKKNYRMEEYNSREQLLLLIDAVEQAVVHTVEIEGEITKYLVEQELMPKIIFYSPDERKDEEFTFSPNSLEIRKKPAEELQKYLIYLRNEVLDNAS